MNSQEIPATNQQHYDRLLQRRNYLNERIAAKKRVGYDTWYDECERNALSYALPLVEKTLNYE